MEQRLLRLIVDMSLLNHPQVLDRRLEDELTLPGDITLGAS